MSAVAENYVGAYAYINSDIYNIENIETFFFGEDGSLYVLFPYGNNKFTSEMDIVKF